MGEEDPLDVVHTFQKVKVLSKKFNFDKTLQFFSGNQSSQQLKSASPQHFHEFFTQILFLTILLVKSKFFNRSKVQNRSIFTSFHPKQFDNFSREIKVEFLDKK